MNKLTTVITIPEIKGILILSSIENSENSAIVAAKAPKNGMIGEISGKVKTIPKKNDAVKHAMLPSRLFLLLMKNGCHQLFPE
jgi:hypothetical protein